MIARSAQFVVLAVLFEVTGARAQPPVAPFETAAEATSANQVDELVFARLKRLDLPPAKLCSDAVFVRRAFLDIIGTLPTTREAADFFANRDPNKRRALVERLLERDEFADYWAMKWSDLLRIKAEFPVNLWPQAAQGYHHWVRSCLKQNMPYDRFVRTLLTSSGSNFHVPAVNFYRAIQSKEPQALAQTVALTFMGERADRWPKEKLAALAGFFSQVGYKQTAAWKEEIVFFDSWKTNADDAAQTSGCTLTLPDGTSVRLDAGRDPREVFADWLLVPRNPSFARNIVNRLWAWIFGRGIIHEPDDIRPDNPPSNPELLAFLECEFVASHYDLKRLYRLILSSNTYQLSCVPAGDRALSETNFGHYALRRLEAEVLIDALNQITGTSEQYTSAIPEPFTFIPEHLRAIQLPDGSIGSAFLELFGRPPRDTGLESERNNRLTAAQSLDLLNSSHIQRKLERSPRLRNLVQSQAAPPEIVAGLYLSILSRYPTDGEWRVVAEYSRSGKVKPREALNDLAWTLINSAEFLYRH